MLFASEEHRLLSALLRPNGPFQATVEQNSSGVLSLLR